MGKEPKGRVLCCVRCSHCKEFGTFRNYTKDEGHFRGIFLCKVCRDKGIDWGIVDKKKEEPDLKPKKKSRKIQKEKKIEIPSKVGITSLLMDPVIKPAKKPS